ncbi:MAG: ABC transporter ATP-binding protein/permease [Lachnospiraceae bacterium]|nr:ABC transporter ATP-binding protein/permease [Lachnospiraceae bacterium]MEE0685502.1 ABC transporter ATP-binding protein/permease [Lachnospiraceae bacterium]
MLQLKNIKKQYVTGDTTVEALKGIDLEFRENEFVSILGQSGCGKTTLLNIIGGLDQYTSGDLIINGKSTKDFKDADWDTYRNNSIGFVFQSYNLIPHQTVLSNVELALTLSGVSKAERRKRATEALEKVGLGDQLYKKPNQMSGGQMQRVAIARALVNNPDILLADEPTGALDSETSVQIMELLKEIAKERLIIMVTHNPELAEQYSTRIIRILDGELKNDSNPYSVDEKTKEEAYAKASKKATRAEKKQAKEKKKKTSMSFFTALSLSMNNLMTKKGRTFLTSFAGSIGIIGIALILALSTGMQSYIDKVQEDALASYPVTIQKQTVDMTTMMTSMMEAMATEDDIEHEDGKIYSRNVMNQILVAMTSKIQTNNLEAFKAYIDSTKEQSGSIWDNAKDVQYVYKTSMNIYLADTTNGVTQVNPISLFDDIGMGSMMDLSSGMSGSAMNNAEVWKELLNNQEALDNQYELLYGSWPKEFNDVVIVTDKNGEISDYTIYALGLRDSEELAGTLNNILAGKEFNLEEEEQVSYTYEELCGLSFKFVPNCDRYKKTDGIWVDMSTNEEYMKSVLENALDINICGIVKNNNENAMEIGTIGYTSELTEYIINTTNASEIAKEQLANPTIDIFSGRPFESDEIQQAPQFDMNNLTEEQMQYLASLSDEEKQALMQSMTQDTKNTYEDNITAIGIMDLADPWEINIYPKDFDSKENIAQIIKDYNKKYTDQGKDEYAIQYSDLVGTMMSSVSDVVNIISIALMAFVSISLVVSSIMIGIITYISVLERTKEIGILRSIGASKKDISRVFNAETFIIGLVAGALGIGITLLLSIPINIVINNLTGVDNIAALPFMGAVILILISMMLTMISGFIPAKMAAKKDPVEALRTE